MTVRYLNAPSYFHYFHQFMVNTKARKGFPLSQNLDLRFSQVFKVMAVNMAGSFHRTVSQLSVS